MSVENTLMLSVKDRIIFGDLFPEKGNLVSQLQVRDITEKIRLEAEERDAIGFHVAENGRGVTWDAKKAVDKAIPFSGAEIAFLKSQVDRLDREEKINPDILDLVLKIKALE